MPSPGSVASVEVYHADLTVGAYNHAVMLDWHQGTFLLTWKNSHRDEDAPGQRILFAQSADGFNWTKVGPVLATQPKEFGRIGDPARPWKARDGRWYQILGAAVKGVAGHAALYRARDATLTKMDFVTSILVENQTVGFGENKGFFDMFECPDFFPLSPRPLLDLSHL